MLYQFIDCEGCTTFEIACSYRHCGSFNHNLSAIQITEKSDRTGYIISLRESAEGNSGYACDGCADRAEPACIEFCDKSEELLDIIRRIVKETENGTNEE